jgi:hypothetical protein
MVDPTGHDRRTTMTDPPGSDRLQQDIPTGSQTGDTADLGPGAEDVPLTREEAIRRDENRPDPDLPARSATTRAPTDDDVPDNGPGIPDPSPRPR